MLANRPVGDAPNMNIGTVIVYALLLILCSYSYWIRSPKQINRTLHLTLIVSVFGLLNGAIFWSSLSFTTFRQLGNLQLAAMFFGLCLTPLTWMVGITLFSVLLKERKIPLQVLLAYFLVFVHFALIITYVALNTAPFHNFTDPDRIIELISAATQILSAIIYLYWGYFLLLLWLITQHRESVPKKVMITLVIFCIMNTISLIVGTAIHAVGDNIDPVTYLYVSFFFTDFISAVSLYITTFFWRDVNKSEDQ